MSKNGFVNIVFVIDESGSMTGTETDVIGGFKRVIDEQRENKEGSCSVSYYKFNSNVTEVYRGIDVREVDYIDDDYRPGGCTALFDAVGTAINNIKNWINNTDEDERPEKNVVVVMTDGEENSSREYSASKVKEMIKEMEDEYNWTFVYMGSDVRDAKDANSLGFANKMYSSKARYMSNYDIINASVTSYRCSTLTGEAKDLAFTSTLSENCKNITKDYANANNLNADDLLS